MSDPFAHKDTPVMNGNVINGQAVAARIRVDIAEAVEELKKKYNKVGRCQGNMIHVLTFVW